MSNIDYKLFRPKTIICIVGPSGSGKTTIANLMAKNGIPTIVSYTTRPMREGEINGKEHWFVKSEDIPDQSDMLAYTKFGDYEYWTTYSQLQYKICTYVIDEKGLDYMIGKLNDRFAIFSLYIDRPLEKRIEDGVDKERVERDNNRISIPQEQYNYTIHNTYTMDELNGKIKDLSEELLKL